MDNCLKDGEEFRLTVAVEVRVLLNELMLIDVYVVDLKLKDEMINSCKWVPLRQQSDSTQRLSN